jgi:transmembrane sensor
MDWLMRGRSRHRCFEEAARWIDDIKHGRADESALLKWAMRSPLHVEAICFVCNAWDEVAALTPQQRERIERLAHAAGIEAHASGNVMWLSPSRRDQRSTRVRSLTLRSLALAVPCVIVFAWIAQVGRFVVDPVYETTADDTDVVALKDGSRVHLNASTRIHVHFHGQFRDVVLERGEALFEVAHDRSHPFRVIAGGATAQALGTQFGVRLEAGRIEVTVKEGRVALFSRGETIPRSDGVEIRQKERAIMQLDRSGSRPEVQQISEEELSASLAWSDQLRMLKGMKLADLEMHRFSYSSSLTTNVPIVLHCIQH